MHIDRAIEEGQGRTQHGAQRLDGEGLQPPGPAFQLDASEPGDVGAMAAGGDDGGIGGDEIFALPNSADAIARALDAGNRCAVVKRDTALLAGGAQGLHEGMMGRRPAIVEDHRRFDPPAIDGGQALCQLRRGERARGDAAVALHPERFLDHRRGAVGFREDRVAALGIHHIMAEAARQAEPEPMRMAEEARPFGRGEAGAHHGAVAPGGAALPIAGIEDGQILHPALGEAEGEHQPLHAAADDRDAGSHARGSGSTRSARPPACASVRPPRGAR